MFTDLRLVLRHLVKQPGFSLLAILTLALGIGAAAATFSVVDAVLLRPMPYPSGERMRFVWLRAPERMGGFMVTPSLALAHELVAGSRAFEAAEIYAGESPVTPGPDGAETVRALHARPSLFRMLGGRAQIGRLLLEEDLKEGAADVAVLSYDTWVERFGRSRDVVNRSIRLDDRVHQIVGVMRPGFRVPDGHHEVFVPLRSQPGQPDSTRRVTVLGVLGRGVSTATASTELAERSVGARDRDPMLERGFAAAAIEPDTFVSDTLRRSSLVLFGAVGLLLSIGCTNVAALLVTRHAARAREVAIRRALGATRGRLVRLFLLEALTLAAAAGAAGTLLAMWALDVARALVPPRLVPVEALHMDGVVLAFTAGVSLLTALAFGLLPALQGSRTDLTVAMRTDARAGSLTPSRHLSRRVLTAAEIALAVVLLVGAGLLVRSFAHLQRIPLGFDPAGTLMATFHLPETRYPEAASRRLFFDRLLDEARGLPGVTAVARATGLPPEAGLMFGEMRIHGRPDSAPQGPGAVSGSTVSDEFFELLRIPVRRGRTFGPDDVRTADRVAVINETMARRLWPDGEAVGQRFTLGRGPKARWSTIIGVVADVKMSGLRGGGHGEYQVYYSTRQSDPEFGSVVLRTSGDPAALAPMLRARVAELDPMLPVNELATGKERVAQQLAAERFNLVLLALFAGVGLLLAATGVYGMMALYVAHRRHELGVRLALGASPRDVTRLVLRQATVLSAAGIGAGVAGSLALTRFMETLLFEVRPTDPLTFACVVVVIFGVSMGAIVMPIRRAVNVDPVMALRAD